MPHHQTPNTAIPTKTHAESQKTHQGVTSQVLDLCETIHASGPLPVFEARALGLFLCVRLTLILAARHNPCQELLAEAYCVSQATVSRVISAYTPPIAQALQASGGPGPHGPADHRRHPAGVLVLEGPPRVVLRQAQDRGAERPGGLHPLRNPGLDWSARYFSDSACLCFRLPSLSPGNRVRPRSGHGIPGLSEGEHDCISARSMRQYR